MLNFTNYQGEKISKSLHQSDYCQEGNLLMKMWRRGPLCPVGGNANWCSHCGKHYGESSKKWKLEHYIIQQSYFLIYIQRKWRWSIEIHGLPCSSEGDVYLLSIVIKAFQKRKWNQKLHRWPDYANRRNKVVKWLWWNLSFCKGLPVEN